MVGSSRIVSRTSSRRAARAFRAFRASAVVVLVAAGGLTAACSSQTSRSGVVHIATINDFHGALYENPIDGDPDRALGGLPWLASALDHLRAEHPDLLVLDGGDLFQGTIAVNASEGMGSVRAFGLLGVDVAAIGNHEFDYGPLGSEPAAEVGVEQRNLRGALEAAAAQAPFRWLAANIVQVDSDGTRRRWLPEGVAPSAIIERGGVRVGIVGLSTAETPQTTLAAHVADLVFEDVVDTLRREVPRLREQGADAIAVVGHLTGACVQPDPLTPAPPCLPDGEVGRILTELPRGTVDLIVAGHTHKLMSFRWDDTFVVGAGSHGRAIGRLDLRVDQGAAVPDRSELHPLWILEHAISDPGCESVDGVWSPTDVRGVPLAPSAEAIRLVGELEQGVASRCDRVGCASAPLGRHHHSESELGNFVADAMLAAFADQGARIAIQNSGGLRASLPEGVIRLGHVFQVMPFDNRIVLVELPGRALRRLLRIGTSGGHGVLQLAGARVAFDPERTGGSDLDQDGSIDKWETDRLCEATVGGLAIDDDARYRLVTTDFLLAGGDHLTPAFAEATVIQEGPLLRDVIGAAIETHDGCIAPPTDTGTRIIQGPCGPQD